jgi:ribosomal protein S5
LSGFKKINRKNSRRTPNTQEPKLVERLIKISRVSSIGWKEVKFSSNCVVGDENGQVGVGVKRMM